MSDRQGAEELFEATQLSDLTGLVSLLDSVCARVGASQDASSEVRLAAEEVFANIMRHGYGGHPGPVTVRVRATPQRITITLTDQAPAFDPDTVRAPDLGGDWDERALGGLGWHLVHRVMDEVSREAGVRGGNVFTVVKNLVARPPRSEEP